MKTSFSNKLFLCAATLAIGILGDTQAQAQPAVEAWVQRYKGLAESDDRAQKAVLDSAGNVFVIGSSDAGIYGSDWLVIKYSNAGVPLWTNLYSGPDSSVDSANDVAVDGSGNVIVTGLSGGEFATIKYSGAGVPLWTNRSNIYLGSGLVWGTEDSINAVAVDGTGNVFVTAGAATLAYSSAGVPLWTNLYPAAQATGLAVEVTGNVFVTGRAGDYQDYVTVKYSQAGVPVWTNRYIVCGYGHGYSVAADDSGNVFVTGSTDCSGSAIVAYSNTGVPLWTNHFGEPLYQFGLHAPATSVTLDRSGNVFVMGSSGGDYVTAAYSNAGLLLWTNRYHGPGNGDDVATAVAVDGGGNVYVTGSSIGSGGYYDYATIKYSGAGVPLWTNRYTGPGDSRASALAVDDSGNVFVTGYSWSGSSYDYATISYSSAGAPLRTNRFNQMGETDDQARAVAVDGNGNVFVTGSSSGSGVSDYATFAYSGAGVPLWTNRYTAPGNSIDFATAVAVDGSGNVFVTGKSSVSSNLFGSSDYATIKYSSAGVPLWINRYDGPGNGDDEATALAVDASGNVFVTGRSGGDYATVAYSNAGLPLWTNRYNGPANNGDFARAMAVDGSGNVVVTGESEGSGSNGDYATIKYSGAGAPLWTNRYNGPGNGYDEATAVAVDGSGNAVVTGYSVGSDIMYDYATIKYSGAGLPLWTNRYDGGPSSYDVALAIAVDSSGNVFVTGGSGSDYATIKYSSAGLPLWTNRYHGSANGYGYAAAIAVDGSGNVVVTGLSSSTNGWPDHDYATIKYSSAGVPLWTNRYSGPANGSDRAYAVAVDGSGNVFVTGESWNGSTFDYVTIKYSSAGVPLLTIARTTTNAVAVSWPSPAAAFTLQQNTNGIGSLNWSNVVTTPADNGTTKTVILNPPAESAFYRLIHP